MSDNMADAVNKRDSPHPTKKRAICQKTVEKWIKENDQSLNTTVWLKFDSDSHDHVDTLLCKICSQFKDKLLGMCNYHPAFVEGTNNVRASSFNDHAVTNIHTHFVWVLGEYKPLPEEKPNMVTSFRSTTHKRRYDENSTVYMLISMHRPPPSRSPVSAVLQSWDLPSANYVLTRIVCPYAG